MTFSTRQKVLIALLIAHWFVAWGTAIFYKIKFEDEKLQSKITTEFISLQNDLMLEWSKELRECERNKAMDEDVYEI